MVLPVVLGFALFGKNLLNVWPIVGGVLLIVFGIALVSGEWDNWMNWLRAKVGAGGVGANL